MKIIALLPVKNEEWILPLFIKNITPLVDEIIAIDDNSTDQSPSILEHAGVKVYKNKDLVNEGWSEHSIRQNLLELGRISGGTHFICLDADEIFSSSFIKTGRQIVDKMIPGERLSFNWITLWKNVSIYRTDAVYKDLTKDFIFCDDGVSKYQYAFLGVPRTPVMKTPAKRINTTDGCVLHFQYAAWNRSQWKQAWYRASELLKGRSPRKINNAYSNSLDSRGVKISPLPQTWLEESVHLEDIPEDWHRKKIMEWFDQKGIEFFESLEIWHIPELKKVFIERVGREPEPKTYPKVLIWLNNLKNKLLS